MERTVLEERDALSMERLASITKEHTAQEPFGDYFRKTASFVIKMDEVYRKIKDGKTESYTLEQWQAFNPIFSKFRIARRTIRSNPTI